MKPVKIWCRSPIFHAIKMPRNAFITALFLLMLGSLHCSADQNDDTLRLAISKESRDRVSAAMALPDILRLRGIGVVAGLYKQLLDDPDQNVTLEVLLSIARTPDPSAIPGDRIKTIDYFKGLLPRVKELSKSSDKITVQCAREARKRISELDKK